MDIARTKALANRMLGKVSAIGSVTVRNEALNASTPAQTQGVRVKLLTREADTSDDAATVKAIVSATAFPIEGGELTLKGVTYDIVSVEQTGIGAEHIIQKVVLRER